MSNKIKIHTIYKTRDDKRVPSVTTILGILNKPALLQWAWQCGVDGLNYREVRDQAADVGTLAHLLIMAHLKGEKPDTSEYSTQDISQAETCLIKYWDWEKENPIELVLAEEPLVSEQYHYGGTIDCLANLNGKLVLIDFKTGKAIYEEAIIQVVSYAHLLKENGYDVSSAKILRIGRDVNEGFEEKTIYDFEIGWQIFLRCLDIYSLKKVLKS